LADLKPANFDAWLDWAMKRQFARRVEKTVKGRRKATAQPDRLAWRLDAAESKRRRKAAVNRVMTILKACLNHAHTRHRVASRHAWSRLKKFRAVESLAAGRQADAFLFTRGDGSAWHRVAAIRGAAPHLRLALGPGGYALAVCRIRTWSSRRPTFGITAPRKVCRISSRRADSN
jgi:hypothetical protein